MNRFRRMTLASALCLLGSAPCAHALTVLEGDLIAVPGTDSTATGIGVVVVDGLFASVNITFSGLFGDATAAGYFAPTFYPLLVPFPSSTALFLTGDFALTQDQADEILAAGGMFFVASEKFPEGEIGGPIARVAEGGVGTPAPGVIPEPSTLVLGVAGLALILLKRQGQPR